MAQYRRRDPAWEEVLDLDRLAKRENASWVWKRCTFLQMGPHVAPDVCLMRLSRGGSDAVVVREFNLTSRQFVPAPLGFILPEAKTSARYEDRDTLLVGTDTGPGSLTSSGYPRTVRRWLRGTPFARSALVFEGAAEDMSVAGWRDYERRGFVYDWRVRRTSFHTSELSLRIVKPLAHANATFQRLLVPPRVKAHVFADQLILELEEDFSPAPGTNFSMGSVVATRLPELLAGKQGPWTQLFQPTLNRTCRKVVGTREFLVLQVLDAVKPQIVPLRYTSAGQWVKLAAEPPRLASLKVAAVDPLRLNQIWLTAQSFLQPSVLSIAELSDKPLEPQKLKFAPATFDATKLEVAQRWARSKDGTAVPYFLVKNGSLSGPRPTVLYGYGGFGVSMLPVYLGATGVAWLAKGGAYALANIRGGGEFGPRWHQAATRVGRHRSFEDFAAVARDLISTGVATAKTLAARGGSNGGLLVGNMLVKYPQLFGAIVSEVPLLDMHRYTRLLAGASWIGEYGDPRNATERAFWDRNSPYHNINSSVAYPPVLFMTSTRDDRVHPAHARKMAARMQADAPLSANHTFFYESGEGGHGSANLKQAAFWASLLYRFLGQSLGLGVASR